MAKFTTRKCKWCIQALSQADYCLQASFYQNRVYSSNKKSVLPPYKFLYNKEQKSSVLDSTGTFRNAEKYKVFSDNDESEAFEKQRDSLVSRDFIFDDKRTSLGNSSWKSHPSSLRKGGVNKTHHHKTLDCNVYVTPDLLELENSQLNHRKDFNKGETSKGCSSPKDIKVNGEILYGIHPVMIALQESRRQIYAIYNKYGTEKNNPKIKEILELAEIQKVPVQSVDFYTLNKLAQGTGVHQGVCASASKIKYEPWEECETNSACGEPEDATKVEGDAVKDRKKMLWLVLAGIHDPMNLGAVLRSAYFFGVQRIFSLKHSSCKLTPVVSKASSGVMELLPIYSISNLEDFLQKRLSEGWDILGTERCGQTTRRRELGEEEEECRSQDISQFQMKKPTVLILGNEGAGLPPEAHQLCTAWVTVFPGHNLHPFVDSLNVSVAAAVILHRLLM